jgi:hypothetical protein
LTGFVLIDSIYFIGLISLGLVINRKRN